MATKFKYDKDGGIIAVDGNGKTIGKMSTMEQFIKAEPPTEEQTEKEKKRAEFEKQWYEKHPNAKRF